MIFASVRSSWSPKTTREARRISSCMSATSGSIRSSGASIITASCTGAIKRKPAGGPDAGQPQNIGAGALHRPIPDRTLVELGNAGAAIPAEQRRHYSGIERVRQPIVRPTPVDCEQLMVLAIISCASKVEKPSRAARVSA